MEDRETASAVDRLVEQHAGLARHLARLYSHRGVPADDLEQVAMLGLVLAAQRFDQSRGVPFSGYASRTIVGELKRHFRDHAWTVRPTRRGQERYLAAQSEIARLGQQLGRSPTIAELAAALRLSDEQVIEATDIAHLRWAASLDAPSGSEREGRSLSETVGQLDPAFAAFEDRRLVRRLMLQLPERDRRVLEMVFFEEKTQRQAASMIGVSQMQVSRIVTRALARMRVAAGGS
jgi:RNA polymerase sigma-B factor